MESKGFILLVGDDEDLVSSTKELLESRSYEVLVARSGKECLEILKSTKPNLVILDTRIENSGEGCSVIDSLRHDMQYMQSRDVPIVRISSVQ